MNDLEKVKLRRIIGPTPSGAAVLLGNEKKTFVVFVGYFEAAALIREINKEVPARPLTHELIQNIFLGFDVEVKHVIISSILDTTFCATLILQQKLKGGEADWVGRRNEVRIDARPSDCFVLALKNNVDIFVTRDVFDQVQDVSKMTEEVESTLASGGQPGGPGLGDIEFDLAGGSEEPSGSQEAEEVSFGPYEGPDLDPETEAGAGDEPEDDPDEDLEEGTEEPDLDASDEGDADPEDEDPKGRKER
ncbi:MAG: bifunctional nuclease family protein [Planctomycetes bacterium]|nr:bifunctional nuclease family protein [Planctomycetota bacterium]